MLWKLLLEHTLFVILWEIIEHWHQQLQQIQFCQPKIATWCIWNYKKRIFSFCGVLHDVNLLTILWISVMPATMIFFVSFSILLIYDNIMLRFAVPSPWTCMSRRFHFVLSMKLTEGFPQNSQGKYASKLEALRERRPPWPRQIITPILPTVKMLSLGCKRLSTPLKKKKKKKKKKVLGHCFHHDLGMLPLLRCIFAHLLILQYPDNHQNLISSSLYYSGTVHKISSQSVHNFLSNVVHRQTNKQTNQRYQKHNLLCQGGN